MGAYGASGGVPLGGQPMLQAPQGSGGAGYPAAAMEMKDLTTRLHSLEKRQRWTNAAIALLVLIAVAWPVALAALAVMNGGLPWLSGEPPLQTPPPAHSTSTTEPNRAAEPPVTNAQP
jgi:hypothetical protein